MNEKIYYVVDIGTSSCVFDNITDACYFMREAAEHVKIGKYQVHRPTIVLSAYTYKDLCEEFPKDYESFEKEETADETTTGSDAHTLENG